MKARSFLFRAKLAKEQGRKGFETQILKARRHESPLPQPLPRKVKGAQHRKILDLQFIIKPKNGENFQPLNP